MRTHSGERPFPCSFPGCRASYMAPGALAQHLKKHSLIRKEADMDEESSDKISPSSSGTPNTNHTNRDKNDRRCELCKNHFPTPSRLADHMRSHTGEKPFVCPYAGCGSRFSRRDNLTAHLRTNHSGDQAFACPYPDCGNSFSTPSNLDTHAPTFRRTEILLHVRGLRKPLHDTG